MCGRFVPQETWNVNSCISTESEVRRARGNESPFFSILRDRGLNYPNFPKCECHSRFSLSFDFSSRWLITTFQELKETRRGKNRKKSINGTNVCFLSVIPYVGERPSSCSMTAGITFEWYKRSNAINYTCVCRARDVHLSLVVQGLFMLFYVLCSFYRISLSPTTLYSLCPVCPLLLP